MPLITLIERRSCHFFVLSWTNSPSHHRADFGQRQASTFARAAAKPVANQKMGAIRQIEFSPGARLSDSAKLWRYVPLRTLFVYLAGKVFIPSIATLRKGDPFEAKFYYDDHPATFNSALIEWYGQDEANKIFKWLFDFRFESWKQRIVRPDPTGMIDYNQSFFPRAYFEFLRATRYAWCWFAQDAGWESALMWNTYGRHGVAVGTSVGTLHEALTQTGRDFEYGLMSYVHARGSVAPRAELYPDHSRDAPTRVLRPYFLKRAEYDGEREVRYVSADGERSSGGIVLSLPVQCWIEEVRLWPGLSPLETEALQMAINSRFPRLRCERSGMLRDSQEEETVAAAAPYFEQSWSDSAHVDDVPSGLKRLWPITNSGVAMAAS